MVDVLSVLAGIETELTQVICRNTDILATLTTESCSLAGTDILRVAFVFPFLLYASYTDVKRRRVDNWVWVVPMVVGLLALGYDALSGDATVIFLGSLINIIALSSVAYVAYALKVFYGADFKALVTLSVAFPLPIQLGYLPASQLPTLVSTSELVSGGFTADNILAYMSTELVAYAFISNLAVFSVLYLFSTGLRNIQNGEFVLNRPLRSLTTRQTPVAEIPSITGQIVLPTESNNPVVRGVQFIQNGLDGISTQFFQDYLDWHETDDEDASLASIETFYFEKFLSQSDKWETTQMDKDKTKLHQTVESERIRVTPGIPFIVPITAAMAATVFVGNTIYIATIGVSTLF